MSSGQKNTRVLMEERLHRRYSKIDPTAKDVDLSLLRTKELQELLRENMRPEKRTLRELVKDVLQERYIRIKVKAKWLSRLEIYASRHGYDSYEALVDDILLSWNDRIKSGRGWKRT